MNHPPVRVLVLCTGNSARSQMAEALFNTMGAGRVVAESAGSKPAARVNPLAISTLAEHGIAWADRVPRGLDGLASQHWDLVVTVCDNAKEACPFFPGAIMEHWGMPDPAEVEGPDEAKRAAFRHAYEVLRERIGAWLAAGGHKGRPYMS